MAVSRRAILLLALSAALCTCAVAHRSLMQSAAPPSCTSRLVQLAGDCGTQVSALMGIGNIPADATDDQIRAALKRSNVPLPTATCCTTSNGFLSGGCRCHPAVMTVVQGQNVNINTLKTISRATELTCNLGKIDTCPA